MVSCNYTGELDGYYRSLYIHPLLIKPPWMRKRNLSLKIKEGHPVSRVLFLSAGRGGGHFSSSGVATGVQRPTQESEGSGQPLVS